MRPIRILLVCGVLLISGGCFLGKKPTVQAPVGAPTPTAATPAPAPAPEQRPATTPVPAASAPAPVTAPPRSVAVPPPTSKPAPPASQSAKPSPFPSVPGTTVKPVPAPAPAPALGTLLTADQRRQLDTAYQSDLRQANAVLGRLAGHTLTTEQAANVSRARDFIRQAAQFHDRDLSTAAELARRARVLTQDLAGTLK